jgi:hypothetical protein
LIWLKIFLPIRPERTKLGATVPHRVDSAGSEVGMLQNR